MHLKNRNKRHIKLLVNYLLGPLLFAWLAYSIYQQLMSQPNLEASWKHTRQTFGTLQVWLLALALFLMLLNWGIEALKWQLAVRRVQAISYFTACKAVLSGVSFSVTTPNRVGEYLGRILYMKEGSRLKAISLTIAGSISQLIITLIMGCVGLLFLRREIEGAQLLSDFWYELILYGTITISTVLTLFYFKLSWLVKWLDRLPGSRRYAWLIESLEQFDATILLQLLSLSAIRFIVFMAQYYLLFRLFDVSISWWQCYWSVSISFLVMAAIPTIALFTDLGLRGTVTLKLAGLFSSNQLGIGLAAASIWFINLIIPALAGSLLILGIGRIFRKKETVTEENT
ncbi:MAG: flippase-like domain-containing protein [Chitinophagaceae bacterium]|nr:flippase-like domain-containing protein [Chitinophagaceae bacterium]